MWTCHVPQFLTRWGTLYPFVCHGLEGRWRSLKAEIKLSMHGQWKGAKVGFAQVLVYSVVARALVRLGIKLVGRTTSVTKTKTTLFDDFCNRMQDVRQGKCTHPIVLQFIYVASLQILHASTVHGAHCAHINMEFHMTAISKMFLSGVAFTVHVVLCLQNTCMIAVSMHCNRSLKLFHFTLPPHPMMATCEQHKCNSEKNPVSKCATNKKAIAIVLIRALNRHATDMGGYKFGSMYRKLPCRLLKTYSVTHGHINCALGNPQVGGPSLVDTQSSHG